MSNQNIKLCINCKWMVRDSDDKTPLCARPGLHRTNPVTGGNLYPTAEKQREDHDWLLDFLLGKTCGTAAKYFELRVEKTYGPNMNEIQPAEQPVAQQFSASLGAEQKCISCGKPFIRSERSMVACPKCLEECKVKDGRP